MIGQKNRPNPRRADIEAEWPEGGAIWWGRNGKEHGGEFFVGLSGPDDVQSVRIPEKDRKRVARVLRVLVRRLDP